MESVKLSICLLFLSIIMISDAGKKKSIHKIIIHVPYKIHKHHHTHTKYKVITVPAPKKENTIIYYTQEKQPDIKLLQIKAEPTFKPPHQESASGLLQTLANHHTKDSVMEAQEVSPTFHHEPTELNIQNKDLVQNFQFQPQYLPFTFQPMLLPHQGAFIQQYPFQPMVPPLQDSIAHSNNQVYKTIIAPNSKTTGYKVKEELKESPNPAYVKSQPKSPSHFLRNVPLLTKPVPNLYKNFVDEEYEHVGYLIIDGNTRKMVGKNFKDELKLSR